MSSFISNSPELTYTISDFINANGGSDEITYHNFSILQQELVNDDTIQFAVSNIIDDYMAEIKAMCVSATLTEAEKNKYYYNPGLLAYDIYGAIELEFIILKINGIIDPKEFELPVIKLLEASTLKSLASTIYNAELEYIQTNRKNYGITMA